MSNYQAILVNAISNMQSANTSAVEALFQTGYITGVMLQQLYANWDTILTADVSKDNNKNNEQDQYDRDSTEATNEEQGFQTLVSADQSYGSALSNALKQLSSLGSFLGNVMTTIASWTSAKLG